MDNGNDPFDHWIMFFSPTGQNIEFRVTRAVGLEVAEKFAEIRSKLMLEHDAAQFRLMPPAKGGAAIRFDVSGDGHVTVDSLNYTGVTVRSVEGVIQDKLFTAKFNERCNLTISSALGRHTGFGTSRSEGMPS